LEKNNQELNESLVKLLKINVVASLSEEQMESSNAVIERKFITATEIAYLSENGDLSSTNEENTNKMLTQISVCY
jgi:hypothetical protein